MTYKDGVQWDRKPFEEEYAVCLIKTSCIKFPSTEITEASSVELTK